MRVRTSLMLAVLFGTALLTLAQAPKSETKPQVTTEEAKQALLVAQEQARQACAQAIQESLKKYGFQLVAVVQITGNQVQSNVALVPATQPNQ